MKKRAWTVLCVLLLAVSSGRPALAQSLPEAKAAFQAGQAAYDRGDYNSAISRWEHSFELSQKVSLFYNIGLAYERMGKLEDAVSALDRFVTGTQPDDPYLDRGRARLALIRERLAQTGVLITCSEEGATILVDDKDMGRTPRPDRIALGPGSHQVIVRKAGFTDFRSDVALAAGEELKLRATLAQVAFTSADTAAAMQRPEEAPEEASAGSRGVLGPVLTIGGGAVAVAGIIVGAVALGNAKDARSQDDADSARTLALVADISMAVGVATAAVGAYLWFLVDDEADPSEQPIAIAPSDGGAVLTARMRF